MDTDIGGTLCIDDSCCVANDFMAWYTNLNFDANTSEWRDLSTFANHISSNQMHGDITIDAVDKAVIGRHESFVDTNIILNVNNYTLIYIAKYYYFKTVSSSNSNSNSNMDVNTHKRILQDCHHSQPPQNSLFFTGFDENTVGVAYHAPNWITAQTQPSSSSSSSDVLTEINTVAHTSFGIHVDQQHLYRFNGNDLTVMPLQNAGEKEGDEDGNEGRADDDRKEEKADEKEEEAQPTYYSLCINDKSQSATNSYSSDWSMLDLLIYDRELTLTEIECIELYFASKINDMNILNNNDANVGVHAVMADNSNSNSNDHNDIEFVDENNIWNENAADIDGKPRRTMFPHLSVAMIEAVFISVLLSVGILAILSLWYCRKCDCCLAWSYTPVAMTSSETEYSRTDGSTTATTTNVDLMTEESTSVKNPPMTQDQRYPIPRPIPISVPLQSHSLMPMPMRNQNNQNQLT